jgi:hypothetical protein
MDAFVSSSFISVGNVHTLGRCCGGKYDECTAFAKQTLVVKRQNEITAFKFFNEKRRDQENGERNEKLHGGEASESERLKRRVELNLDCAVSFIQFPTTAHCNAQLAGHSTGPPDGTRRTTAFDFSAVLGRPAWF